MTHVDVAILSRADRATNDAYGPSGSDLTVVLVRTIQRIAIAVAAIVVLLATFWARDTFVWRHEAYWRLIDGYKRARSIKKQPDANRPGFLPDRWHESIQLPDGVTATVEAPDSLNARATVTYSDASTARELYQPRDYTTVVDLRIDGTSVYVLRSVELLTSERRLALFDLTRRLQAADRRVDRGDVGAR
jgi:hypothetical protein